MFYKLSQRNCSLSVQALLAGLNGDGLEDEAHMILGLFLRAPSKVVVRVVAAAVFGT